jgi:predicted nucleic acid-binding protein
MIVISDSSCLINLHRIALLHILPELFQKIVVPAAVFQEITNSKEGKLVFTEAVQDEWIEVAHAKDNSLKRKLEEDLDAGEAEAIVIAIELNADLIIIDELKGREVARRFNLNYTGLLGILLTAKRKDLIISIQPVLTELKTAGFWISNDLYNEVLKLAGEG